MSGMIFELNKTMEKQLECYDYLFQLSEEKRDVIINNDLETLKKITMLENKIVKTNNLLEEDRESIISDIALVLGLENENLTISKLLEKIKYKPGYESLFKTTKQIKQKIQGLKSYNEQNKTLINNSLEYTEFTLNIIRSSFENETPSYGGTSATVSSNSFFDTKQ